MKRVFKLSLVAVVLCCQLCAPFAGRVFSQQRAPAASRTTSAPSKYASRLQQFEEFARKQLEVDRITGLTIGFMSGDEVWVKGFGYADVENRIPAKPESAYRLASVTKPMTALAVLQLVEKGKINLDAEVQTYVPYFPKKKWPVTVRQLLGHLGGISHYKDFATELHIKERKTTREAVAIFENFDLLAEPGTRYSYSSYGYNLLGAVIEAASGQAYGDYMREHIWLPLGMTDTHMDDPLAIIPNRVRGYQLVNGQLKNSEFIDISSRFSAGGTRSTVPDLLKFAKGLNTGKLLSKANMEAMYNSMQTRDGRLTDYGMGWETNPQMGRYIVRHTGGQQETRTVLYHFPDKNLAIAAATNFEGGDPTVYAERLFQMLFDEPFFRYAYTKDRPASIVYAGVHGVYNEGLNYFQKFRRPVASGERELAEAFAYFNGSANLEALRADEKAASLKIRDGRHPAAGQPFAKIGSHMAARLAEKHGPQRLEAYSGEGAIPFFNDYIQLYKSTQGFPAELRFSAPFEQLIATWQASWTKTNTEYVRKLMLTPDANLEAVAANLQKIFAGGEIYPNLLGELIPVIRQSVLGGEKEKALRVGNVAVELYPASDTANAYLAIAYLLFNEREKSVPYFKKAVELNPNGLAGAGGINGLAYQLAGAGKTDAALELLKMGVELHPREANLYDSIGEFYAKKGDKEKAVEHYRKALEIDPKLKTSLEALERLSK